MTADERWVQNLGIAAEEFAVGGLHGTSTETIARRAGITQAYIFRLFGSKKNLFVQVVQAAFEKLTDGMRAAPGDSTGLDALSAVRDAVRASFARMWHAVADTTGLGLRDVDEPWAHGVRTRIQAGLFTHITSDTNR